MLSLKARIDIERYLEPLIDIMIGLDTDIIRDLETDKDVLRIKKKKEQN